MTQMSQNNSGESVKSVQSVVNKVYGFILSSFLNRLPEYLYDLLA